MNFDPGWTNQIPVLRVTYSWLQLQKLKDQFSTVGKASITTNSQGFGRKKRVSIHLIALFSGSPPLNERKHKSADAPPEFCITKSWGMASLGTKLIESLQALKASVELVKRYKRKKKQKQTYLCWYVTGSEKSTFTTQHFSMAAQ